MCFNVDKCKVIHQGNNNPRYTYHMKGQELAEVDEEKDIGVVTKSTLKPKSHCVTVAGKARRILYQIAKNFHYRDKNTFVRLYKMFVRPHLEYAVTVWGPWMAGGVELLEGVQRKAVGMVSGLRSRNYEDKLKELELDSLATRRLKLDMTETFKIIRGFSRVESETWFQLVGDLRDQRSTRQTLDPLNLRKMRVCNTDIRNNFFSQRVINNWNRIPSSIKNA